MKNKNQPIRPSFSTDTFIRLNPIKVNQGKLRQKYAVYIAGRFWHCPLNTIRANGNEQSMNIAKSLASNN